MTLSLESNALNPLNRLFSCRVFNPCLPLCILALMSLSTYAAANENTQKPVAAKKPVVSAQNTAKASPKSSPKASTKNTQKPRKSVKQRPQTQDLLLAALLVYIKLLTFSICVQVWRLSLIKIHMKF
jgi:hypothetical protein